MTDFQSLQQQNDIDNISIDIDIISCFNGQALEAESHKTKEETRMKNHRKFLLSSISIAVLTLIGQAQAAEQEGQPATAEAAPAPAAADAAVQKEIQQVVVTGVASARGVRKLDSAFSITTASEEQLKQAAPISTADVMKLVPGAFAESTGGQSGANIQVRGFPSGSDSPFVSVQMQGNPLYPVSTLSFFEGSSAFRLDDTIERVEVLRGGPSTSSPAASRARP